MPICFVHLESRPGGGLCPTFFCSILLHCAGNVVSILLIIKLNFNHMAGFEPVSSSCKVNDQVVRFLACTSALVLPGTCTLFRSGLGACSVPKLDFPVSLGRRAADKMFARVMHWFCCRPCLLPVATRHDMLSVLHELQYILHIVSQHAGGCALELDGRRGLQCQQASFK